MNIYRLCCLCLCTVWLCQSLTALVIIYTYFMRINLINFNRKYRRRRRRTNGMQYPRAIYIHCVCVSVCCWPLDDFLYQKYAFHKFNTFTSTGHHQLESVCQLNRPKCCSQKYDSRPFFFRCRTHACKHTDMHSNVHVTHWFIYDSFRKSYLYSFAILWESACVRSKMNRKHIIRYFHRNLWG